MIFTGKATHNAAVDGDVLRVFWVVAVNKDIARVHIRMEEVVAKYLGKEKLNAALSELFQVGAPGNQGVQIGNRDAANTLLHHDMTTGKGPVDRRYKQQWGVFKITLQL